MRVNKYRRGETVASLVDAIRAIEQGRYLYLRDKPIHPSMLISMSVWTIKQFVCGGSLAYAEYNWLPINQHEIEAQ